MSIGDCYGPLQASCWKLGHVPAATNGGARGRQGSVASRVWKDACRRLGADTIGARSILPWAVEMEARLGLCRRRLQRSISRSAIREGPGHCAEMAAVG